jgi:hypothetical protein
MTTSNQGTQLQLRSLVRSTGQLELSLAEIPIPHPSEHEVLVRIEAAPLNDRRDSVSWTQHRREMLMRIGKMGLRATDRDPGFAKGTTVAELLAAFGSDAISGPDPWRARLDLETHLAKASP